MGGWSGSETGGKAMAHEKGQMIYAAGWLEMNQGLYVRMRGG